MTEVRIPNGFAAAMKQIADLIDWPACAEIAGKTVRNVQYWGQDSCSATPPIATALALDVAFQKAGGQGAPFRDAYVFQFREVMTAQDACRRALAEAIAEVTRESGDALAASIEITQSDASPLSTLRASAEVGQLLAAANRLARRLVPFDTAGVLPVARETGGLQ